MVRFFVVIGVLLTGGAVPVVFNRVFVWAVFIVPIPAVVVGVTRRRSVSFEKTLRIWRSLNVFF